LEGEDIKALSAHPFGGGEAAAHDRVNHLINAGIITSYKDTRNGLNGPDFSTKLSAWLAIGCLTARQVHAAMTIFEDGEEAAKTEQDKEMVEKYRSAPQFGKGENEGTKAVRFELLWRDYMRLCAKKFGPKLFSLYGFKNTKDKDWIVLHPKASEELRDRFDRFLCGTTGISLIDAAQREIFLTGYCSNRVRQNVASFLAKTLSFDWRLGAEWYEAMLVDYDVSSNWGNWQYVAGVGNDPRDGRVFNPVKQALDYDSKGEYIKRWIPELRELDVSDDNGGVDQEKLMGLYQAWRIDPAVRQAMNLDEKEWVHSPLVKIPFSVGRKPRSANRSRGNFRGRGASRGWGPRGNGRGGGGNGAGNGGVRGGYSNHPMMYHHDQPHYQ
jgi:deoxyribodipyrimidine photo-lyase